MTLLEAAKEMVLAMEGGMYKELLGHLRDAIKEEEARLDRVLEGAMAAEAERREAVRFLDKLEKLGGVNAELSSPSAEVVLTEPPHDWRLED